MILTVTINPLLERRLYFEKIILGNSNRSIKEEFSAGGKGINVSRQLNYLGIKNSAFTFMGGGNGKILRHLLTEEKIEFSVVQTKSETRSADLIIDLSKNSLTTYFGLNSNISKEESEEFKHKLDKIIQNCSIVVFSGSSPCKETDDIFPYGIKLANMYDKISIVDTYGAHLKNCIDASPTVIHNNISETEESLNIKLETEKDKIDYLKFLYSKNIKLAFLTDGGNSVYSSKYDFHYKVNPLAINVLDSTGSGDAFTAGLAYGLENSLVYDDFLKCAVALGSSNSEMWSTCVVSKEKMELYSQLVNVEPIGKKMKILNDTPNY